METTADYYILAVLFILCACVCFGVWMKDQYRKKKKLHNLTIEQVKFLDDEFRFRQLNKQFP